MLLTKNLDAPDETRSFEHGELTSVSRGGVTFARAAFRPGWRWSTDIKSLVGTESCQVSHQAIVISGRLRVKMDSGEERELAAGDAHVVSPGHDAWVVGDEPCVILDFTAEPQKSSGPSQSTQGPRQGTPQVCRPASPPVRAGSRSKSRATRHWITWSLRCRNTLSARTTTRSPASTSWES